MLIVQHFKYLLVYYLKAQHWPCFWSQIDFFKKIQNIIHWTSDKDVRFSAKFVWLWTVSFFLVLALSKYLQASRHSTDRISGHPVLLDLRHGLAAHVGHSGPQLLRLGANGWKQSEDDL